MKNKKQLIIICLFTIIVFIVLLVVYSRYNSRSVEFFEKEVIEQETKFPKPPEERYLSGVIKSVGEESFIIYSKDGREMEIFFNDETEILQGEGKGEKVSREAIQPDWHAACFLPRDKDNNTALIVHLTTSVALNNKK